MTQPLPVLGAAMISMWLFQHHDWVLADQRDLEIQDPAWFSILDSDWRSITREIRATLNGYTGRVGVHGPFEGLTLAALDPRIRDVVRDRYLQALDFCADIGGTHMVIHSPFAFLGSPFLSNAPDMGQTNLFDAVHATLSDVLPAAEKIGCTLVIENVFDRTPALLRALVESFASPYVQMSVDVGHAYMNHMHGAPPPDVWIRAAGERLGHLHLQDTDGYDDRHWLPGEGVLPWEAIFREIASLEQRPRLILELDDMAAIPRAVAWFAQRGLAR